MAVYQLFCFFLRDSILNNLYAINQTVDFVLNINSLGSVILCSKGMMLSILSICT